MFHELRLAARSLFRRRGLLALAVLNLGLGIGATTLVFSLVNGVLLRPLPYRGGDRMAVLWHQFGEHGQDLPAVHPADYRDYRERSRLLEELTILSGGEWMLAGEPGAEMVDVAFVGANFFRFLGVDPRLGRHFLASEDSPGGPPVVLIGHELWARRFGSDPSIVGRTLDFDEGRYVVVGVLPADFGLLLPPEAFLLKNAQVWRPARIDYGRLPPRNWTSYSVFVRLRPGVSFAQAQEELSAIAARLREEHPEHAAAGLRVRIVPFLDDVVGRSRGGLLLLSGAVGLVLLLACGNVAMLLLVRGRQREREFLLRAAVGASRWRLAQAVLAEGFVIAVGGAGLGVVLARIGLVLTSRLGAAVPRLATVTLDGSVLGFVLGISALSALLFAGAPALRTSRLDLSAGIEAGARGSSSVGHGRAGDMLVVGQFALAFALVVGAGLAIQGFRAFARVDPGFEPQRVLTVRLALPRRFPDESSRYALFRAMRDRLQALPGVSSVAAVSLLPLAGSGPPQPFAYDERTARNWDSLTAEWRRVSPGFFATLGATVLEGREFVAEDLEGAQPRVVVDDRLARLAFPGRSAVGQRLQIAPRGDPGSFAEIVGVVAHVDVNTLAAPSRPQFYEATVFERSRFHLAIRTTSRPRDLVASVRRVAQDLGPDVVVEDPRPMHDLVSAALMPARLALTVMSAFGTFALLLAALGVYGTLSFAVGQRKQEIAVRMALGEEPQSVRRRVLFRGLASVGLGLVLGAASSALLGRLASAWLHGVHPADPVAHSGAALLLAAAGVLACWFPAEQATRVDPMVLLRHD